MAQRSRWQPTKLLCGQLQTQVGRGVLGFRGFRVDGLRFRVIGFKVGRMGLRFIGFRVQGLEFRPTAPQYVSSPCSL